jgi:hypothetical protein
LHLPKRRLAADSRIDCTSRTAALRRDQVIEGLDLGIKYLESPLTIDAILADGGSLARRDRLKKLIAEGTAALLIMSRIDNAPARDRPAAPRGRDFEDLTARRVDLGCCCWNGQQSGDEHDAAQHGKRSDPQ